MEIQYYEHTCLCGCGDKIEIEKHHKYYGIPKYILGHSNRNKKFNEIHCKKISESKKDKKLTEEHKKKLKENRVGMLGKHHTEETKEKIKKAKIGKNLGKDNSFYGKTHTIEVKQKIIDSNKDKIVSEETRQKIRLANSGKNNYYYGKNFLFMGKNNPNWQGGKSFELYGIEFNKELKQQILTRDAYTCQCPDCKRKIYLLDIHHIDYDKKNNSLDNLITLCKSCHMKTNGKNNRYFWIKYYQNIMENKINV